MNKVLGLKRRMFLLIMILISAMGIKEGIGGNFSIKQNFLSAPTNGLRYGGCVFGDFDNDGDLDIAVTGIDDSGNARFMIYTNSNGDYGLFQEPEGAGNGYYYSYINGGDFDNDGDIDLVVIGLYSGGFTRLCKVYTNNGSGNFSFFQNVPAAGVSAGCIGIGDIDGDSDLDLIILGTTTGTVPGAIGKIYTNNGNGSFALKSTGIPQLAWASVSVGDVDGDGDMDLLLTGRDTSGSRKTEIHTNDGKGNFGSKQSLSPGGGMSSAFGDIDGDGDLDAIVSRYVGTNRYTVVYKNDGTGSFSSNQNLSSAVNADSIALGDIDNDGDLDVAILGYDGSSRHTIIYTNSGNGSFGVFQNFMPDLSDGNLAFGDIDNDKDLDLLMLGYDGSNSHLLTATNSETVSNSPPSVPTGLYAVNEGGYWKLVWSQSTDDYTPQDMLRYQVAIGTNSGVYNIASTNIDYQRGEANLGKVTIVTGHPYYQTRITNTKTIYWKVCGIDSAFIHSSYSPEHRSPVQGPYFVSTTGDDGNEGSKLAPFKTIQRAVNMMSPGPPVCTIASTYIFPGIYNEKVMIKSNNNTGYMVITALSNTNMPVITGGWTKDSGFVISNTSKIEIRNLIIKNYTDSGISLTSASLSNRIIGNIIYSNNLNGIDFNEENVDNNYVYSNTIYGMTNTVGKGIKIIKGDYNEIKNNKIYQNGDTAILVGIDTYSNLIEFNEIYSNLSKGIDFGDTSTNNFIYGNIIYGGNQQNGIFIHGFKNTIRSNNIYNHILDGIKIGFKSQSNRIEKNYIAGNGGAGIVIGDKSADNNFILNNQIISNFQQGIYIFQGDNNRILDNHISGNGGEGITSIEATGTFFSNNYISFNQTGINLKSSTNFYLTYNTICSNKNNGIEIGNCFNITITNNSIYNSGMSNIAAGIAIYSNSSLIYIEYNSIYSNVYQSTNFGHGIWIGFPPEPQEIYIITNEFYGVVPGILNTGGDKVYIAHNVFHNIPNWVSVYIETNNNTAGPISYANSNSIMTNYFYGRGIEVKNGDGHLIIGNKIIGTPTAGIRFTFASNSILRKNQIIGNYLGISIYNADCKISRNAIKSNSKGIEIEGGKSSVRVLFNNISYNTNEGLQLSTWDGSPLVRIRYNNIVSNGKNFATETNADVRTNWWGTSIKNDIRAKFGYYGPPGTIFIQYEPYRLWHKYSLVLGADVESPSIVTGFTSWVSNNYVKLSWNKVTNSDFVYYCIYRHYQDNYGILEHTTNYIIATTTNTNYTDNPGSGVYYYWITAVDDPAPPAFNIWTNESWYSEVQKVTVGTGTNVHNLTQDKWYWTIQDAVKEANTGDIIEVYPYGYPDSGSRIYKEQILITEEETSASNLTIRAYNWISNGGIIDTVIDGTGYNRTVFVGTNRRLKLYGFKIKNENGNGIVIESSGNTISHNIIYSNYYSWSGMGVPPMGIRIQGDYAYSNNISTNTFHSSPLGIGILGAKDNLIYSNTIFGVTFSGIGLADSSGKPAQNNVISNNIIYNSYSHGISFHGDFVTNNLIKENVIYNCTNGIFFEKPFGPGYVYNWFIGNIIYSNKYGITCDIDSKGEGNQFLHNKITNNLVSGIEFSSSNFISSIIETNYIKENPAGILLNFSWNNIVSSNMIIYNTNGIEVIDSSNNKILRNSISFNTGYGIIATNFDNSIVQLNNIVSNQYGLWCKSGTNTEIVKNNIYSNTIYNARQSYTSGQIYTNNWWGDTIWTNIVDKIEGNPPSSVFKPWRLFGKFDIKEGADTDTPLRVSDVYAGIIDGTNVVITWTASTDKGGGNLYRYFIYKGYTNSPDNVSRKDVIASVPAGVTSYTDYGGWKGTNVYYSITALDDYSIYTNESWYSEPVSPSTNVWNVTKNIYYNTIKEAIADADGSGVYNEIRILTPQTYYEDNIQLNNDQNIYLVSAEWLNSGTYTNTVIASTNSNVTYIFRLKNNARLVVEGISFYFKGTNEDWGAGNVSGAIVFDDTSTGEVKNCKFDGLGAGKIGILAFGWLPSGSRVFYSNKIMNFTKGGIHVNTFAEIYANRITNCGSGIYLDGGSDNACASNNYIVDCDEGVNIWGDDNNERVIFNLIVNPGWSGVWVSSGASPEIRNNTIAHGVWANAGISIDSNASPVIKNNIIFSNGTYGIYAQSPSTPQISYNNIYGVSTNFGGVASPGPGDISDNTPPIFTGGSPYDYHLAEGSPSIAAGENNVDQGCYPYDALLRVVLGSNTKSPGTFLSTETNIPMIQIRLKTERPDTVVLKSLTFTNLGSSSANLPLEIQNVELYADVDKNGYITGSDVLLVRTNFGLNNFATFTGINLTIPGNSETNLIISYDATNAISLESYLVKIDSSDIVATTNGVSFTVYGNVTGNTQIVSSGIDHFVIIHQTNAYSKVLTPIAFVAKDSNDLTINTYNGTISIWVLNDSAEVYWTNINGYGALTDGGAGNDWAKYTFAPEDNGIVTLYVKYYTNGYINIECQATNITSATDNDIEGDLYFTNAPVWNVTIDEYYGTLRDAIENATPTNRNEIRIMYSYNDGNVLIATNTTTATEFYITSQEWATSGTKNTVLDATGFDKAISIDSRGLPFKVKIEGFTVKNAYVNGIELLANTTECTVANMIMISNGYTVTNYPGPAGFGIYISDNQQAPTFNNAVYSNEVYFSQWGIVVLDADLTRIFGNTLKYNKNPYNSSEGGAIAIASMGVSATNNEIFNNFVCSNLTGIAIAFNGDNLFNNRVYNNQIICNQTGIYVEDADNNFIYGNYVANNTNHGIALVGSASYNEIFKNSIYTNKYTGICISTTNTFTVVSNTVFSNTVYNNEIGIIAERNYGLKVFGNTNYGNTNGIYIFKCNDVTITNNELFNNNNGLLIDSSSNFNLIRNKINNNSGVGIYITNTSYALIELNTITNNSLGIIYFPSAYTNLKIWKNNIYNNTSYNLENPTTGNISITNNWWGSTIASNIRNRINPSGAPYSVFTPYRLFGPFDISEGADTTPLPSITWVTAYVTNNTWIKLVWRKPAITNDFARYFIYCSDIPGTTNLTRSYVKKEITSLYTTNWIDTSPLVGQTNYYHITVLDSAPYTNESWYSIEVKAYITNWTGPFYVDDDTGSDSNPGTFYQPFRTIQKAADVMSSGPPVCTIATTYIFPGTYSEQIEIYSNANTDYMVFTKLSNTSPVLTGSLASNYGFYLTNTSKVVIRGLTITKFTQGILVRGISTNNYFIGNEIYSNEKCGINVEIANNNYIVTNNFWGANQDYGIIVNGNSETIIKGNVIQDASVNGIYVVNATDVWIGNNTIANQTSSTGVKVVSSILRLELNSITNNAVGVYVGTGADITNVKNNIYGNSTYNLQSAIDTKFTNIWWGSTIKSNIMAKVSGVSFTNIEPYRLFGPYDITEGADTEALPRITWATAYVVNSDDVVIKWTKTSGADFVKYNIYRTTNETRWSNLTYADVWTQINNISTTNITNYNLTPGTYYYYITAMDDPQPPGGSIYTNECWYSPEAMAYVSPPTNVHNVTIDKWYTNITSALAEASNGHIIVVYPGVYNETVDLTGFSNLTLQAYAWTNAGDNSVTVIAGDNNNPTVVFDNTKKCRLIGFTIKYGKDEAIYISDNTAASYSNYIGHNIIFSNEKYGITLDADNEAVYGNIIVSNIIYSNYNGGASRGGIYVNSADNNRIEYNTIYKFDEAGIVLISSASNNYIFHNTIYSNVNYGILINDNNVLKNTIMSNSCYNNDIGIFIGDAGAPQDITGNFTYKNTGHGIFVQTPGNRIYYNTSYSNTAGSGIRIDNANNNTNYGNTAFDNIYGIYIKTSPNTIIQSNIFYNNDTGVYGSESSGIIVRNNKIYNNVNNGIYLQDTIGTGTTGDSIINNFIYSNNGYGIYLNGDKLDNNEITSNQIYVNASAGIYINLCDNNRIFNNTLISGSTNGIYIVNGSQNTIVSNNYIANNTNYGIYAGEGTGLKINLNTITSNFIGIEYNDNVANPDISWNNIYNNTKWNFALTVNRSVYITNVWWGTTIVTNILSKITNAGPSTNLNFIPYRLFGELNIEPGADVVAPQIITNFTTYVIENTNIVLNNWTKVTDSDFVCYRIYRSTNSSFSNLSPANIVTQIYDVNVTSWTDRGLPPGYYYYHITYIDNPEPPTGSIYTNESWYSVEGSASIYKHVLKLTINSNIPSYALYPGETNKTVMAFNVMDWWLNETLGKLMITNSGTMSTNEITLMKLWIDDGTQTNQWDGSDTFVGIMSNIPGTSVWVISNIFTPPDIGNPGENFVITIDISTNALGYKTFRGIIFTNFVECDNGKHSTNSITNQFYQYIPARIVHNLTQDLWYTNIQPAVNSANNGDIIEVYPGEFIENVDINNKDGITLRARSYILNGIKTNTIINGNNAGISVRIRNGTAGMKLLGFTIKNGNPAGVQIDGAGTVNNKIFNNIIYSNLTYGIYIDNIQNNTNYGNIIYDTAYGIYFDSQPNIAYSNTIYNCSNSGICLLKVSSAELSKNYVYNNNYGYYLNHTGAGSSSGNVIRNSEIYSNTYGIYLASDKIDASTIISNNIWDNTEGGIYANRSDSDIIKFNTISGSKTNIFIASGSDNEIISNNYILSGSAYGIYAGGGTGLVIKLNSIVSNKIGLYYEGLNNIDLSMNNIKDNTNWNYYGNTGGTVEATNIWWGSTIYTNIEKGITNSGAGVLNWVPYRLFGPFNIEPGADTTELPRITWATAYVVNFNDIVVKWTKTTGADFVKYNVYRTTNSSGWSNLTYNDVWTQINNISITNITNYNMAMGTYYYYITAMDSSTPYTNECWYSPEAKCIVVAYSNVHNVTKDIWYSSITNAIADASNNNLIEVYPGTYNEYIKIIGLTNLTLRAWSWTNSNNNTNTIINGSGYPACIIISNSKSITIEGFSITSSSNGIYITGTSISNYILNNNIYSHKHGVEGVEGSDNYVKYNNIYNCTNYGIWITWNASKYSIISNTIYSNGNQGIRFDSDNSDNHIVKYNTILNGADCIVVNNADNVEIFNNTISGATNNGVLINGDATNCIVSNNIIYSNTRGIIVSDELADNNFFISNTLYDNSYGISIWNADSIVVRYNSISNSFTNGVELKNSTNTVLYGNEIYNTITGIVYSNSLSQAYLNTVVSNNYGIKVLSGNFSRFDKNNIYNNTLNFLSLSAYSSNLTNNWWGTTIATNIVSKISNAGFSNIIPYRLFGPFNIEPGADTTELPRITWATAYVVNFNDIVIKWTKTTGADFVKYNVYRTTNSSGWSNLTYNDVWTQINNISITNITNYNMAMGTYYYYITAMDSSTPYTNECWYSPEAIVFNPGVVWITNYNGGKAYTDTILRNTYQTNVELIAFKLTANTYKDAVITSLSLDLNLSGSWNTNYFTNFKLYEDTGTIGTYDGTEKLVAQTKETKGNYVLFSNITGFTVANGGTNYLLVLFGHKEAGDTNRVRAVFYTAQFTFAGIPETNYVVGGGSGIWKEVYEPGFFRIIHDESPWIGYVNQWEDMRVEVRRKVRTNEVVPWFDDVITLDTTGTGNVVWTNLSGAGVFSNTSFTQGVYYFTGTENGVITLALKDDTAETLDVEIVSTVTSITDDDTEGFLIIKLGELAYFEIIHRTNAYINQWTPVVIKAISTNGGSPFVLSDFEGNATITVSSHTGTIEWTNISGNGSFTETGGGNAVYSFVLADSGVVTLNIKDDTMESIDIDALCDGKTDTDTEGYLHFWCLEPFIISITPEKDAWATSDEVQNIAIDFSQIVDETTLTNSIYFYDEDGNILPVTITPQTNHGRSRVIVETPVSDSDILKEFILQIKTNIKGTNGYTIVSNPMDSTYSVPYLSRFTILIDKERGGLVNKTGINLSIPADSLPDDAYVEINKITEGNSVFEEAKNKAELNQFIKPTGIYYDIKVYGRDKSLITKLNGKVYLSISYSDADNNGFVDNTDIAEEKLRIFVLNEKRKEFELVKGSVVYKDGNYVKVPLTHFSIYALMGWYQPENFEESVMAYPNPVIAGRQNVKIKFYLEKDAKVTIKIFTPTGKLVKTLVDGEVYSGGKLYDGEDAIVWDCTNENGRIVVVGTYIIYVKAEYLDGSGEKERIWKEAVIK